MKVIFLIFLAFPNTETRSVKEREEADFYVDVPENILEIEEVTN